MALHKDLTGNELHEPKGVDSASSNQVYVSDGIGSGTWTDVHDGIENLNMYDLNGEIVDISTANSSAWFYIPRNSELVEVAVIIDGAIATADAVVSIYINGTLFAESVTVPYSGSATGDLTQLSVTTSNSISAGSVVELRSNGASTNAVRASTTLVLQAQPA